MSSTIAIEDLKVGMFIHLDLGWMSHPFPLSNFKIVSTDQIATLRALSLSRVRWSPSRSDLHREITDPGVAPARGGATARDARGPAAWAPGDAAEAQATVPSPPTAQPPVALTLAERQARQLATQTEAARRCEDQFAEAAQDLKRTMDKSGTDPIGAGEDAQRLAGALLAKMTVDGDLCVRVLVEAAGDRVTAHALNVTVLALLMGRMFNLPPDEMLDMGIGALMHDVGKLDLPDRARHVDLDIPSPDTLLYRDHVALGLARAQRMKLNPQAQLVVAQHHEAADGSGFPKGLNLERMSTASRVVALVNRYDSLCNAPPPMRSLTPHEALSKLFALSRSKFDNTMLNAFIRMMGIYPPGSVVQLTDDRYAMVMSVNSARPLKPTVMVCDPQVPVHQSLHIDLERAGDLGIRRSLKPQQLPPPAADYLQPRQRVAYFFDLAKAAVPAEEALA